MIIGPLSPYKITSRSDLDDNEVSSEALIQTDQLNPDSESNCDTTFITGVDAQNSDLIDNGDALSVSRDEAGPIRLTIERSFFTETKNHKKANDRSFDNKPVHNFIESATEGIVRGKSICARINQEVSDVIARSKLARRRLLNELLSKVKDFLMLFRSLNLPKEYMFDFPLKPFFHPKSRTFLEAIKLGDVKKVKDMSASTGPLLVYEFDHLHQTRLHIAAKKNDEAMVAALLKLGAHADSLDSFRRSALFYAIENQNTNVVYRLLIKNASPWSTKGVNYMELAHSNITIRRHLKLFRHLNIMLCMNPRSKREHFRQQFIASKIDVPRFLYNFD
jgi:hypothetical protein